MGMVTRCPACSTLFRVTPQQLQAHRGQVRCGACRHVFDGFDALEAEPEPQAADSQAQLPPQSGYRIEDEAHGLPEIVLPETVPTLFPFVDVVPPDIPQIPRPYAWAPRSIEVLKVAPPVENVALPEAKPDNQDEADPVTVELPVWTSSVTVPLEQSGGVSVEKPSAADVAERSVGMPTQPPLPRLPSDGDPDEARPRRRWPWALLGVLLVAVAAAQAVQQFGAEMAARQPTLRPILQRACGLIRCDLSLPQRPKLINIEASDLQAVDPARPGLIQLAATLRNHAGYDVGYPSIDLVLTNTRDHTLARRIFIPRDYLPKSRDITAGIPANAEFTVRLDLDTGDLAASGFRLDLLPAPAD